MDSEVKKLIGKIIAIDTDSRWLYVGTLKEIDEAFLVLENADAHDLAETGLTRDIYLLNIKNNGLIVNRKKIAISKERLVSLSLLEDLLL